MLSCSERKHVRLDEVCITTSGGTPSRNSRAYYEDGTIPWVKSGELRDGPIHYVDEFITELGVKESSAKVFPAGTLLIALYGATAGRLGVLQVEAATNQAVCAIFPGDRISRDYLFFYLLSIRDSLIESRSGGAQPNISQETVRQLQIPLPALPEQQRIAGILSRADRLRRLRRYALEMSESSLGTVFLEMFWSSRQVEWPATKIEELAKPGKNTIRTGPFGSQLLHSEFVDKGIAVLGIDNAVQNRFVWAKPRFITEKKYQKLKRYTVFPQDVIITIMGTTGRCAVVPDVIPTAINTKHLCCITCDQTKCLPVFLKWAFLTHPLVRRQLDDAERGAIMPGLNMGIIKQLEFPLPPLYRQECFAEIVSATERINIQQREALRQTEHLFQTLLYEAFGRDDRTE